MCRRFLRKADSNSSRRLQEMSQDSLLLLVQVRFGELPEQSLVGLVRVPEERLEVLLQYGWHETDDVSACSMLSIGSEKM